MNNTKSWLLMGREFSLRRVRDKVRRRDDYTCQRCGLSAHEQESHTLEVHHITPRSAGGTDETDNLITLCQVCHDELHSEAPKDEAVKFTGDSFLEWVEQYDGPEKEPWDS